MGKVRVLRLLEYEYEDLESAELDMSRWGVPMIGARKTQIRLSRDGESKPYTIRSTSIVAPALSVEPEPFNRPDADDEATT